MKKIFLLLFLVPYFLHGGITGKIAGKVVDGSTKEPLINASVILEGTKLGAVSDLNGNFLILNIPPGIYNLKVSYIGYNSYLLKNIRVIIDQTTNLEVELLSKNVDVKEVVITASAPLIQKDITSSVSTITREEIDALPVTNFTELLSLQAGVAGGGSNLHVRGGRANEVAYLVDGMYVKDPLLGNLATQLNTDAIQEMSLMSGTFNAEYGNALSGVVNAVTREGGDEVRGKIDFRTSEFGIKEYSDYHQLRINGSLSGPIYKDLKFFITGEKVANGSYLPFGFRNEITYLGKLTFTAIPDMKVTLSNRGSTGNRKNYSHTYKYIPERSGSSETESYQGILSVTHMVTNNFFYDLKFSYFRQSYFSGYNRDTSVYASEPFSYLITTEGNKEYRDFFALANPTSLTDSRTGTANLRFDLTWQVNKINEIKFGLEFKKHSLKLLSIAGIKRPINLQYIDNYSTDEPFELANYIQDKIELPYLIINLGLRFDYLNANVSFRDNPLDPNSVVKVKSRFQLSPRIGIAHPISEKTKLHFAYGHFFQNPDFQYLFENKDYKISVREPIFGQPNLDAERTVSYEVGLSHQLSDRISVNLTAHYKDITGLVGTRYLFPYIEGRFIGYTLYINEDYANVKGFEVNLDIRPDRYFSGGLTYTYSVARGSASSETEQYPGTQESTLLYYLDWDKPHIMNATAVFTVPENEGPKVFGHNIFEKMDFSMIFTASSGYPYTPSGRDVGFVNRNSLRQPAQYNLDIELGKEVKIIDKVKMRIFAEILNVLNTKNVVYVYPDTGDPDYTLVGNRSVEYQRDPSNYGAPRYVRIGIGIKF